MKANETRLWSSMIHAAVNSPKICFVTFYFRKWRRTYGHVNIVISLITTDCYIHRVSRVDQRVCLTAKYVCLLETEKQDINDPLGQIHSLASSDHCFLLFCFARFEKWWRTYGQTTCAKTMITTSTDCGLAEWINRRWFRAKKLW